MARRDVPPGYSRFRVGGAEVVALTTLADAVRTAMGEGSLYDYAAHHPEARAFRGRGVVYAVPLPGDEVRVVVRRSRHGGLLARVTGERFLGRTRAPRELETSLRLARLGVPTPEVVAYATYPGGGPFSRADVMTREIAGSSDLAARLAEAPDAAAKEALLHATAALLARLTEAGARHPDLNLANVLVAPDVNGELEAVVLDVDRVWFDRPGSPRVTDANLRRLARSARKWRAERALAVDEGDLIWLAGAVDALLLASRQGA